MEEVVLFRGRHTEAILNDAKSLGIIHDDTIVTIICRESDKLAKENDIPVEEYQSFSQGDSLVIIANGGTSAQLVPVIMEARTEIESDAFGSCSMESRGLRMTILDLRHDGIAILY